MKKKLFLFFCILFLICSEFVFSFSIRRNRNRRQETDDVKIETKEESDKKIRHLSAKQEFDIFCEVFPFAKFELGYDNDISDWTLSVTSYGKTSLFYCCDGLYLPKEEIPNRDHYWSTIYDYQRTLRDPADFTEEEKEWIRNYSSDENRKNGTVSSKFIFDAIYDCATQHSTETHLRSMTLWGKPIKVHRMIGDAVDRVEAKVYEIAKTDAEVAEFLKTLGSCYGYNWREIRDSPARSFHSYGIALDILPRNYGNKVVYWGWEKARGNADWMLIPLSDRWMPPSAVLKAFEEEGFIWGGQWEIWDNMHFEYHPELFAAAKIYENM